MINSYKQLIAILAVSVLCGAASAQEARQAFFDGFELLKDGKAQEAIEKFETGLQADPDNAVARYYLGEALFSAGQKDQAREQLKKSLELDPNSQVSAAARKRLGEVSGNAFADGGAARIPTAGTVFRDCPECPEMVAVPAGQFIMGSPPSEPWHSDWEGPPHLVTIGKPFAVGKYEVTFQEWDACVAERACGQAADGGWGRGRRPVIGVKYEQAVGFTEWLSEKTGKKYRLLSEAEWEYAARGGSDLYRYWGIGTERACQFENLYDARGKAKHKDGNHAFGCDDGYADTAPVGSYKPNAFGLYDMLGNVMEWVGDCYNDNYSGAPSDGGVWSTGKCWLRVVRGGSWNSSPGFVRSAARLPDKIGAFSLSLGFRVARTLP